MVILQIQNYTLVKNAKPLRMASFTRFAPHVQGCFLVDHKQNSHTQM